jgi:hypothetical protein
MKKINVTQFFSILITLFNACQASNPAIKTELTPTWTVLREYSKPSMNLDAHKAICVGRITLHTKSPVKLTSFLLKWEGPHIKDMYASIYLKRKHGEFATLSTNLVCDGKWNTQEQNAIFPIQQKIVAQQNYYLVIGTKQNQELNLKAGRFSLITSTQQLDSKKTISS